MTGIGHFTWNVALTVSQLVTCYDECVSQFVTCCHQCAGMRLCEHYLQHQSSAWQRRVLQEQRGGGVRTYARSASTGNLQIASPKS